MNNVQNPLGYVHAYDIVSLIYMYYMFSKILLVFAIWGVSKDTVFALSPVLLKDSVFAFANLDCTVVPHGSQIRSQIVRSDYVTTSALPVIATPMNILLVCAHMIYIGPKLVKTVLGVSKDTVFALSLVLLKRQPISGLCLRLVRICSPSIVIS